jgi:hypothetical protein
MALEDSGGISKVLDMARSPLAPLKKGGTALLIVSLFTEETIFLTVSLLTGGTILLPVSLFTEETIFLTVSLFKGETILLKVPLFKGDLGGSSTFFCDINDCSDTLLSLVGVRLAILSFPPSPRLPVSPPGTPETGTD